MQVGWSTGEDRRGHRQPGQQNTDTVLRINTHCGREKNVDWQWLTGGGGDLAGGGGFLGGGGDFFTGTAGTRV